MVPCTRFTGVRSTVSQNDFFQPSNTFRFPFALILHGDLTGDSDCHSHRIAICYKRENNGQSKRTYVQRPHKLHILRFRLKPKAHSFRCSSFPQRNRFTGFRWGPSINAAILPAHLPVRTYASNHRKTLIYDFSLIPQFPEIHAPAVRLRWSHCCSIPDCSGSGRRSGLR